MLAQGHDNLAGLVNLRGGQPSHTAQRGLLIQSAAYTLAHRGDRQGMRQLTDEAAAIAAARQIPPQTLPTVERRARYHTDVATTFGHWGKRDDCLRALLSPNTTPPKKPTPAPPSAP